MSYLLINYYYTKIAANKAAIKAILYNRIGDVSYLIGITILILTIGTTNIEIFKTISNISNIDLIVILLMIGAMSKSAQYPLHGWLGDAMQGPTPVSALIHAATLVTS